jgi:hypothetical protein
VGDAVAPKLHGRDHCPGGVDPIPCLGGNPSCAIARFGAAPFVVPLGSIVLDEANLVIHNSDDSIFTPSLVDGAINIELGGGNFLVTVSVIWEHDGGASFVGGHRVLEVGEQSAHSDTGPLTDAVYLPADETLPGENQSVSGTIAVYDAGEVASPTFFTFAKQSFYDTTVDGGDATILFWSLTVTYLGPVDGGYPS